MASFCPHDSGRSGSSDPVASYSSSSCRSRVRRFVRGRGGRSWGSLVAALVVLLVQCGDAGASTLTWSSPCSGDLDPAGCERLTWLAQTVHDGSGAIGLSGDTYGALYFIAGAIVGTPLAVLFIRTVFGGSPS